MAFCRANGVAEAEGRAFVKELQREALETSAHVNEMLDEESYAAQRMWTSGRRLKLPGGREVELCSIVNAVLRDDDATLLQHAVVFLRTLNQLLVVRGVRSKDAIKWPAGGVTYRGGGLPRQHHAFYQHMLDTQTIYRVPGLLATSFDRETADTFMLAAEGRGEPVVEWVVRVHPDGAASERYRCRHVNYVTRSHFAEEEFLFAAYAPFKVTKVQPRAPALPWRCLAPTECHALMCGFAQITWDQGYADAPHVIELAACMDSQRESEELPLAPWF